MSEPSPFTDVPFPLPPGRQPFPPAEPLMAPAMEHTNAALRHSLADQRRILVSGPLDGEATAPLVAQLMTFDGQSDREVELVINSPGGPLPDVFPILDVLALMRADVHATAIGSVSGTAVAVVAACRGERRAAAHARFSLRLDTPESIEGTADQIARHADELAEHRRRYLDVLAAATGRDHAALAADVEAGAIHTADEALTLGLIDVVARR